MHVEWKVHERQDGTKSLKLGDFGLATVVDKPLCMVCGTLTYVAPEVLAEVGYDLVLTEYVQYPRTDFHVLLIQP